METESRAKTLVLDMDDVLVNITPKWVWTAKLHPEIGALESLRALPASWGEAFRKAVASRNAYYVQSWLAIPPYLREEFDALYRDDPSFYDALPPTPIADATRRALLLPGVPTRVVVVTHTMGDDPVNESKRRWLLRLFGGKPAEIYLLAGADKKSDLMARECPEPDSFVDDSMKNVVDVLMNDRVRPRQILVPRMGHNPMDGRVAALARLRRIEISYYGAVHNPAEDSAPPT